MRRSVAQRQRVRGENSNALIHTRDVEGEFKTKSQYSDLRSQSPPAGNYRALSV